MHVIGPHAGFTEEDNFSAKINDIKETTMTFWYSRTFNSSSKVFYYYYFFIKKKKNTKFSLFLFFN